MDSKLGSITNVSKRLVLSYVIDWLIVIATVAVGAAISNFEPNKRPFSLIDPNISFPFSQHEKVTSFHLGIVSFGAPAIIVFLIALFFVPGRSVDKSTPRSLIWRRKFWEWHTGWLGLALTLAIAYLLTNGLKNLFGKPRPDLLSRCNPNIRDVSQHIIGGYGDRVREGFYLVSPTICQNQGSKLDDGFRSFPSGHASYSWAGMTYLTLFICSKFAIAIPFLAPRPYDRDSKLVAFGLGVTSSGRSQGQGASSESQVEGQDHDGQDLRAIPPRNQAAAPPTYLLIIAMVPIGTAIYITSTRYSDFRHHGWDILFGSVMGFAIAWFSFRWYHLPLRQGAGWSWGARSRDRAFGIGVGVQGYVGSEGWENANSNDQGRIKDLEPGQTRLRANAPYDGRESHLDENEFDRTRRDASSSNNDCRDK